MASQYQSVIIPLVAICVGILFTWHLMQIKYLGALNTSRAEVLSDISVLKEKLEEWKITEKIINLFKQYIV